MLRIKNSNQQSYLMLLTFFYITFLSDLYYLIDNGFSLYIVIKLGFPIYVKIICNIIDYISKYNFTLFEWWNSKVTFENIITYIFKIIHWIYNNEIHKEWNFIIIFNSFFYFLILKTLYNFIFYYFSYCYLFFTLVSIYGVYLRFNTSSIAFITLFSTSIELGCGILLSEHLEIIDTMKDYCIKNNNTWITYIIKLLIGYYGCKNTDYEEMCIEISEYIGVNYLECEKKYKESVLKKVHFI